MRHARINKNTDAIADHLVSHHQIAGLHDADVALRRQDHPHIHAALPADG